MTGLVIAGIDGSEPGRISADLAADAAVRRGMDLELLHAFVWPLIFPPLVPEPETNQILPRSRARALIRTAETECAARYPTLTVRGRMVDGHAAGVLVDASRRADFLYIGHRGLGGFTELLLGSVGVGVTAHAHCPVVVTRGAKPAPGAPVVVGVDGSPGARDAARVAFEEARSRDVPLVVVVSWPPARVWPEAVRSAGLAPNSSGYDPLAVSLDRIADDFPDVKVSTEVRRGPGAPQLLAALAEETRAGLLVIGSRGIGGFRGLLMGGTARALIDHAPCPVMVIPKHSHAEPTTTA